ncbi:MAG: hypothetical protein MJ161_04955 [Clostridia bacterium]|nr:hypothetical protein [Clostridia bacterium]
MEAFIDIHTHILPDVDGGAKNLEEAKAMARASYNDGVRTIVATPHFGGYVSKEQDGGQGMADRAYMERRAQAIREAHRQLCEACADLEGLEILLGSEIFCSAAGIDRIIALIKDGLAFTINGTNCVMIEMNYLAAYSELFNVARLFSDAGYTVLLAHAERYECLFKDEEKIGELIDHGVIIQMNAASIIEPKGILEKFSSHRKWGKTMIEDNLVHILGSDCHSPGRRGPNLAKGIETVRAKFGNDKAEELQENARKILMGEYI